MVGRSLFVLSTFGHCSGCVKSSFIAPEYLLNLIVSANNKESYDTRFLSSDNFFVPKPNTELHKSSFSFSGPKVWISLPNGIKTSKTVFEFKNSYKLLNFY